MIKPYSKKGGESPPSESSVGPAPALNPFRALAPYEERDGDAHAFYGRDQETAEIAARITTSRAFVLYGRSGTGKTSIVRAGLVRALRERSFDPVYVRLLGDPASELARVVGAAFGVERGGGSLVQILAARKEALEAAERSKGRKDARVRAAPAVLLLDQFEEVFLRSTDRSAVDRLAQAIAEALAAPDLGVRVVFSLRDEHLARLDDFQEALQRQLDRLAPRPSASGERDPSSALDRDLLDHRRRLRGLSASGAREAFTRTLYGADVDFEEELLDALLVDLQREAFDPLLLQIVCTETFEHAKDKRHLALADYKAIGGVAAIFDRYLERAIEGRGEDPILRVVLATLCRERHKRALTLGQICGDEEVPAESGDAAAIPFRVDRDKATPVLADLVKAGFVAKHEPRAEVVLWEVVHDRAVERARTWLGADALHRKMQLAADLVARVTESGVWRTQSSALLSEGHVDEVIGPFRELIALTQAQRELLATSALHVKSTQAATFWLGELGAKRAGALCTALLDSKDDPLRAAAALGLAILGAMSDEMRRRDEARREEGMAEARRAPPEMGSAAQTSGSTDAPPKPPPHSSYANPLSSPSPGIPAPPAVLSGAPLLKLALSDPRSEVRQQAANAFLLLAQDPDLVALIQAYRKDATHARAELILADAIDRAVVREHLTWFEKRRVLAARERQGMARNLAAVAARRRAATWSGARTAAAYFPLSVAVAFRASWTDPVQEWLSIFYGGIVIALLAAAASIGAARWSVGAVLHEEQRTGAPARWGRAFLARGIMGWLALLGGVWVLLAALFREPSGVDTAGAVGLVLGAAVTLVLLVMLCAELACSATAGLARGWKALGVAAACGLGVPSMIFGGALWAMSPLASHAWAFVLVWLSMAVGVSLASVIALLDDDRARSTDALPRPAPGAFAARWRALALGLGISALALCVGRAALDVSILRRPVQLGAGAEELLVPLASAPTFPWRRFVNAGSSMLLVRADTRDVLGGPVCVAGCEYSQWTLPLDVFTKKDGLQRKAGDWLVPPGVHYVSVQGSSGYRSDLLAASGSYRADPQAASNLALTVLPIDPGPPCPAEGDTDVAVFGLARSRRGLLVPLCKDLRGTWARVLTLGRPDGGPDETDGPESPRIAGVLIVRRGQIRVARIFPWKTSHPDGFPEETLLPLQLLPSTATIAASALVKIEPITRLTATLAPDDRDAESAALIVVDHSLDWTWPEDGGSAGGRRDPEQRDDAPAPTSAPTAPLSTGTVPPTGAPPAPSPPGITTPSTNPSSSQPRVPGIANP